MAGGGPRFTQAGLWVNSSSFGIKTVVIRYSSSLAVRSYLLGLIAADFRKLYCTGYWVRTPAGIDGILLSGSRY